MLLVTSVWYWTAIWLWKTRQQNRQYLLVSSAPTPATQAPCYFRRHEAAGCSCYSQQIRLLQHSACQQSASPEHYGSTRPGHFGRAVVELQWLPVCYYIQFNLAHHQSHRVVPVSWDSSRRRPCFNDTTDCSITDESQVHTVCNFLSEFVTATDHTAIVDRTFVNIHFSSIYLDFTSRC